MGRTPQPPPIASVVPTVCSAAKVKIEAVMAYAKWYILAMFVVLMAVTFLPWMALVQ